MNCLSILGAAALILTTACTATAAPAPATTTDSSYNLVGTITGLGNGWVYLRHIPTNTMDSIRASDGKFSFSGMIDEPQYCLVGIMGKTGREFRAGFFLDKGTSTLQASKDSLSKAVVSGTPTQDEFNAFSAKEKQTPRMERFALAKEYIKAHPSSYVSALELDMYFSYDPDPVVLADLYNGLDENIKNSHSGKIVKSTLDAALKTNIGQIAPPFQQADVNGKQVSLADFKGQYVLIDFWASWCGPCREENPAVAKAYKAYHSKGFTILGVSLDDNKARWLEAIKKDGLKWTHVSDLKGWQNSVAIQYGIAGVPMNFLVDKEGKIIAKGLRGEDLEKKLAEVVH